MVRPEIGDTLNRMRTDLAHRWTLAELGQDTHLSPSRLRGLFVKQFSVPPIAMLARLRVRQMARLLRETHQPVRDIARAVGWTNQAHAARQFRKLTGLSPTEYRANVREAAVVECFWCGQRLPASERDGDPRASNGDPGVHG